MNLDGPSIIASSMIGIVGFSLFLYGKKQQRPPQLIVGVLFMVFPYFVPSALGMVAIALALVAALYVAIQRGH
jgi:hypothetical protein